MDAAAKAWPRKKREIHNHHMDSAIWNEFPFRDDDVVIATWAKAGTTWVQQIVGQLVFAGAADVPITDISPWVELRFPPREEKLAMLEAQDHRRILKTHLPVDALVLSPRAKYIYVARDGRDILVSLYNHHVNGTAEWYRMLNDTPGRVGPALEPPPDNIRQYFYDWLAGDGYPFWEFWSHIQGWWDSRDLPNVMLLHFNELKADLAGSIRRIAGFLEIAIDEAMWPEILRHCTFEYMKGHADKAVPHAQIAFKGGGKTFIHKGTNERWRNFLTAEDSREYESAAAKNLTPDCAHWLATGERRSA